MSGKSLWKVLATRVAASLRLLADRIDVHEEDGPPADWVRRVRKGAPQLLKKPGAGGAPVHFAQRFATLLPASAESAASEPAAEAAGQAVRVETPVSGRRARTSRFSRWTRRIRRSLPPAREASEVAPSRVATPTAENVAAAPTLRMEESSTPAVTVVRQQPASHDAVPAQRPATTVGPAVPKPSIIRIQSPMPATQPAKAPVEAPPPSPLHRKPWQPAPLRVGTVRINASSIEHEVAGARHKPQRVADHWPVVSRPVIRSREAVWSVPAASERPRVERLPDVEARMRPDAREPVADVRRAIDPWPELPDDPQAEPAEATATLRGWARSTRLAMEQNGEGVWSA